jgi:hypothetical protein
MNVMPQSNTADELETAVLEPKGSGAAAVSEQPEAPASAEPAGLKPAEAPAGSKPAGRPTAAWAPEPERGDATAELMARIAAPVRELADSAERYHTWAKQRENVIDHSRAEAEWLRAAACRVQSARCVAIVLLATTELCAVVS